MRGDLTRVQLSFGIKGMDLTRSLCALLLAAAVLQGGWARAEDRNKCGCYRDEVGSCLCDRKARCGCPGDCEPRGCEEQRSRELQKQIDAETKHAEESARHRPAAKDDDSYVEQTPTPPRASAPPARPQTRKLSRAQSKELSKLIELYLLDHPDGRSKTVGDLRDDLAEDR